MLMTNANLVGVGLYTVSEAHRLTGARGASIRRWLLGYRYRANGSLHEIPPVWESDLGRLDDSVALSFHDLMEVRFVAKFREAGVPLSCVRLAAEKAREWFGRTHPFSTRRFRTDGRRIFLDTISETGDQSLLDIASSQFAFRSVLLQSLFRGLIFSPDDEVVRWYPMANDRSIVVDPDRSFGRPIVSEAGVPTEILAAAYVAEASFDRVAKWYQVPVKTVRAAVRFEHHLAA